MMKREPRKDLNPLPWKELARYEGSTNPMGKVVVIVSQRDKEISYAVGFLNGTTLRPQRFFPHTRIEEILDLLDEAAEKHG